jgi:hypothetical protein
MMSVLDQIAKTELVILGKTKSMGKTSKIKQISDIIFKGN